jgi:error-prone DNA polymerase
MYVELHTASAFSFLDGASLPEALVQRAADLGYPALALLDRDGVYGIPRFHLAARRAGIKAIVGAEVTIALGTEPGRVIGLPLLVATREGYRNLSRLITRMKLAAPKGEGALTLVDLDGQVGGLIALAGPSTRPSASLRATAGRTLDQLVGIFGRGNVYVELQRHLLRDEEAENHLLRDLAAAFRLPVVATNGVRFAEAADRPLYDVLTCIRHKTTLEQAGRRLSRNAERMLKSPAAMARLFADLPGALAETRALADRLEYTMADLGYRFPEYPVPPGETMTSFLRTVTEAGARDRYRPYHDRARAQVARELDLIEKLDLAGYFLIVWDLINFCRREDILVQGRGSAANSAVCYSLGITAVDPVGMELLFERFLSEERGEWPDIDIDLPSGDRRERVIQYVYQKYGRLGAAMTANVITYRGRSAAREVGKTLALDAGEIDRLAKIMNQFEWVDPKETLDRNLREAGIDADRAAVRRFAELWLRIQDLPRHLGQHSGGMVICRGRLDEVVPLENASMPDRVVVQWDKDDCADMGLVKVDLLGLGMMAVLQDALTLVNGGRGPGSGARDSAEYYGEPAAWSSIESARNCSEHSAASSTQPDPGSRIPDPGPRITNPGCEVDLAHLPPNDPAVYRMLQAADTVGIFQVESRAQMATLPRLKPRTFYDIVVEVAIIRPGPIVGQMVHPYLRRRKGEEAVRYPHPSLEPILKRTLGVPLFQEQLLRMAMTAAGFSGGEAEELRRAFGFKRSEKRMHQIEGKLRAGMTRQGITGDAAEEIIRSITSFALYGFPESHAASFALLVYASAYLKAHHSAAFYTAMLNNQPMGFYHPATLVKDAQRRGVRFAPIDVQVSDWTCRLEPDGRVRLGLMYVSGLRQEVGKRIVECRESTVDWDCGVGSADGLTSADCGLRCPKCGCDDASMLETTPAATRFCNVCAHEWGQSPQSTVEQGFHSIDDFVARTGVRRDELATLAAIGALNAFGYDRRGALWQIERAARPSGELFPPSRSALRRDRLETPEPLDDQERSPLRAMTTVERVKADYDGTGLTIGPHPMAMCRGFLARRGVQRAIDLPAGRSGRRVQVAGAVITRQRPGTAKGFVFLTLEDETGIANIIVRPDIYSDNRSTVVNAPYLLVEGTLQIQDGVTSVKAERVHVLAADAPEPQSHDFR